MNRIIQFTTTPTKTQALKSRDCGLVSKRVRSGRIGGSGRVRGIGIGIVDVGGGVVATGNVF